MIEGTACLVVGDRMRPEHAPVRAAIDTITTRFPCARSGNPQQHDGEIPIGAAR
jgi:hypothetical protein